MLLVANFANAKMMQKMTEILAHGYSSESTQRELSNEYQHDRVQMVFKNLCVPVLWMEVALALEGLKASLRCQLRSNIISLFSNACVKCRKGVVIPKKVN